MHTRDFFQDAASICEKIDEDKIESIAHELVTIQKSGGRLFILGVGGSAANASHAVNDFRKLCGIESYTPTDNVSELTARANDDGWVTTFTNWLKVSRLKSDDAIMIFSVGGGTHSASPNLVEAISFAKGVGCKVFSVVGRSDGYAAKQSDIAIIVPYIQEKWITPLSEAFQMVVLHCLVSHPLLQTNKTRW